MFDPHVHKRAFENVAVQRSQRNKTNKIYAQHTNLQLMSWRYAEDKQTRPVSSIFFFFLMHYDPPLTRRAVEPACELTMLTVNKQS